MAESLASGAKVAVVARRHGLNPSQLSQWRRELSANTGSPPRTTFAPVIVESDAIALLPVPTKAPASASRPETAIEIARGGWIVRVTDGIDAATLATVLQALAALP